jgi:hypothetical protein
MNKLANDIVTLKPAQTFRLFWPNASLEIAFNFRIFSICWQAQGQVLGEACVVDLLRFG